MGVTEAGISRRELATTNAGEKQRKTRTENFLLEFTKRVTLVKDVLVVWTEEKVGREP